MSRVPTLEKQIENLQKEVEQLKYERDLERKRVGTMAARSHEDLKAREIAKRAFEELSDAVRGDGDIYAVLYYVVNGSVLK